MIDKNNFVLFAYHFGYFDYASYNKVNRFTKTYWVKEKEQF